MKSLTLGLLALSMTTYAHSSSPDLKGVISRIDSHVTELKNSRHFQRPITVPWEVLEERERNLFASILKGYELLKSQNQQIRYTYLYDAITAAAKTGPNRVEALLEWTRAENIRIYSLGLSHQFYSQWKEIAGSIQQAINQLNSPKPEVDAKDMMAKRAEVQMKFLTSLKEDLSNLPTTNAAKNNQTNRSTNQASDFQMVMMGLLAITAFLGGFLIRSGKKAKTKQVIIRRKTVTAPAVVELPKTVTQAHTPVNSPASVTYSVNLEEKAIAALEESKHLFEVAGLKLHTGLRSPFNTQVNAPSHKVTEALNWLIKGTLAVANNSSQKASHAEWNCKEQNGRVSLEIVLHGIEADSKSLYMNVLADGEGSAPAHFGRTEMALAGHLASVGIRTGAKRTTVSLGLDSRSGSMTH